MSTTEGFVLSNSRLIKPLQPFPAHNLPTDPWASPHSTPPSIDSSSPASIPLPSSSFFNSLTTVSPYSSHALSPITYSSDLDPTLTSPYSPHLKWTPLESHPKNSKSHPCYSIEKASYGPGADLLRFRSLIPGYSDSKKFADMIMTTEERKKWDIQCDEVYQIVPLPPSKLNDVKDGPSGKCTMLGVGYCRTLHAIGGLISPREQLTLCGIIEGVGGSVIWGVELPEECDGLFPEGERKVRASTDLFGCTLIQGEGGFEVEYVLKLDVGGKVPGWTTAPVVVKTVKELFRYARNKFEGEKEEGERIVRKRMEGVREEFELLIPQ
ncbi:hypothetical protein TrVE_jg3731 [Triparma verrucosa]|uniref:START domain-containing protein n=1 Tax=Triparma verrucosa TaxID=1606542 RepID=A0A9W7EMZ8_9STRA|nr:hypothetical protein TrVE_jg3731 [Triparma verrucosa]